MEHNKRMDLASALTPKVVDLLVETSTTASGLATEEFDKLTGAVSREHGLDMDEFRRLFAEMVFCGVAGQDVRAPIGKLFLAAELRDVVRLCMGAKAWISREFGCDGGRCPTPDRRHKAAQLVLRVAGILRMSDGALLGGGLAGELELRHGGEYVPKAASVLTEDWRLVEGFVNTLGGTGEFRDAVKNLLMQMDASLRLSDPGSVPDAGLDMGA